MLLSTLLTLVDKEIELVPDTKDDDLLDKALHEAVLNELQRFGLSVGLQTHEIPSLLLLTKEEWSPQNRLLTVSFKVVRTKVIAHYEDRINACYESTSFS